MRIRYLKSAGAVVGDDDVQILCDPWIEDGAYYGSWAHYPPLDIDPEDFNHVDYIYISHVHPDHCNRDTLAKMDDDIPVLVHDYRWDYLKDTIESLGFEVRELPNNERVPLTGDWHINVVAADNCDPELCGNFFGCDWFQEEGEASGSTQVDSFAVIDDCDQVVVDTNDCPFDMAKHGLREIKEAYGEVDALLHQYTGAQFYPQAVTDYTHEEKLAAAEEVIEEKLEYAEKFVELLEPRYHLPFAGQYFLAGRFAHLNEYKAIPEREEALEYFRERIDQDEHECVFLNSNESIDLETGERSSEFEPVDRHEKRRYIVQELADRDMAYENEPRPDLSTLKEYVPAAYERLEEKRATIDYETDTDVLVRLRGDTHVNVSMAGEGWTYEEVTDLADREGYVRMDLDPRLLQRIFDADEHAHWADAKIGSHIGIEKRPDIYERGLYNCMSSFYA